MTNTEVSKEGEVAYEEFLASQAAESDQLATVAYRYPRSASQWATSPFLQAAIGCLYGVILAACVAVSILGATPYTAVSTITAVTITWVFSYYFWGYA